jgi:hypothetical protein
VLSIELRPTPEAVGDQLTLVAMLDSDEPRLEQPLTGVLSVHHVDKVCVRIAVVLIV